MTERSRFEHIHAHTHAHLHLRERECVCSCCDVSACVHACTHVTPACMCGMCVWTCVCMCLCALTLTSLPSRDMRLHASVRVDVQRSGQENTHAHLIRNLYILDLHVSGRLFASTLSKSSGVIADTHTHTHTQTQNTQCVYVRR